MTMTDDDIGLQLRWRRDGADWELLYRARRMGRVVPDGRHPGMFRSPKSDGRKSDMSNLTWAKAAVMTEAIRELAWDLGRKAATDPSKCSANEGVNPPPGAPVTPDRAAATPMAPNYLAPLATLAPTTDTGVPVSPECYGMMSDGLKQLYAARDAQRDLMVAMLHEPERARQQTMAWLMADEPPPSTELH